MSADVSREVKDQAILLAGVKSETTPHHLIQQTRRKSRTKQCHAVHIRRIKSSGQNIDIHQVADRTRFELRERIVSFSRGCLSIDVSDLL
jgi:hypothetical protein